MPDLNKTFFMREISVLENIAALDEFKLFVHQLGLHHNVFFRSFGQNNLDFYNTLDRELNALKSLESKSPGIIKYLNSQCGIFHFSRYPEQILLKQYQKKDDLNIGYGLVLAAGDDKGSETGDADSYQDEHWQNVMSSLDSQLGEADMVRIIECVVVENFFDQIIKFRKKYGNRKAKFLYLAGHGNNQQFFFSSKKKLSEVLDTRYIHKNSPYVKILDNFLDKRAQIVFDACSLGKIDEEYRDMCLAPELASCLNRDVIASEGIGSISELKIDRLPDNSLRFYPKFSDNSTIKIF